MLGRFATPTRSRKIAWLSASSVVANSTSAPTSRSSSVMRAASSSAKRSGDKSASSVALLPITSANTRGRTRVFADGSRGRRVSAAATPSPNSPRSAFSDVLGCAATSGTGAATHHPDKTSAAWASKRRTRLMGHPRGLRRPTRRRHRRPWAHTSGRRRCRPGGDRSRTGLRDERAVARRGLPRPGPRAPR